MNYTKTNTAGVDTPIERIKNYLYSELLSKWNPDELDVYGRIYKNTSQGITYPEYYIGDNEYKEVLLDDTKTGIIFFSVSDFANSNGDVLNRECDVIVSIDLNELNGNTYRTDAHVQRDVFKVLNNFRGIFSINRIETGLNNVYSDFNGVVKYFNDMQGFHHFKINGIINYTNNC